jgi:transcriptional regulator with XRE-family HTH domain
MTDDQYFLREWRLKRGLSQQELARKVGVNKSQISRIERNPEEVPVDDVLLHILKALNITPKDIWLKPPLGPEPEHLLRERSEFWQERQKYPDRLFKIEKQ